MDYLPYPPDATLPPFAVPYLPGCQFDGGEFHTFFDRMGLSARDIPTRQHAGVLQEWLFFGLIEKLVDEPINRSSFVRRGMIKDETCDVIDASPVRDLIDRLTVRLQSGDCPAVIADELPGILYHVRGICESFRLIENGDDDLLAVYLSVCILVEFVSSYLYWAINSGLAPPRLYHQWWTVSKGQKTGPDTGTSAIDFGGVDELPALSRLLHKRLIWNGWCENQILNLNCHDSQMVMYYLSSLPRRESKTISHANCTFSSCSAYNTSEAEYITRHVNESCKCDFLRVDEDRVVEILAMGKVPLISIHRDATNGFAIDVVPLKAELRYTAISHVWVDGLGNTSGNALPGCQLDRLHGSLRMHQQLSSKNTMSFGRSRSDVVVFWMDTLCIPVKPQHKELRLRAINQMALVYSGAENTLVLDEELQRHERETQPPESLWARCLASKWNSRCWTFQEGMLAKRCLVQFKDCSLAISPEPRLQPLPPIRASHVLGKRNPSLLSQIFSRLGLKMFGTDPWEPLWSSGGPLPQNILIYQLQEACYKQAQTNTDWLTIRDNGMKLHGDQRTWHFISMWHTIAKRSSTKMDDIHVILANLTDFKASQIQAIPNLQDRTKVMLQSMDRFPVHIMYSRADRPLAGKDHPDRWIPAIPGPEQLDTIEMGIKAEAIGDSGSLILISHDAKIELFSGIICLVESKGMTAQEMFVTLPLNRDGSGMLQKFRLDCDIPPEDELVRDASQKCVLLLRRYYPDRAQPGGREFVRGARFLVTRFVDTNHEGANVQLVVSRFDCPISGYLHYGNDMSNEKQVISVLQGARLEERQRLAVECLMMHMKPRHPTFE
ncbi:het domain protein [Colletotrichum plurivorum]|uniref:Het domain protein n=1 Tax=Colletotrichum plurivorum TaxID=2175906 RepID=A0A8H6K363_9PEZI|nr:het domain protein [Colletotrichum plurivorum]